MKMSIKTLFVASALAFTAVSCSPKQEEKMENTAEGAVTPDGDGQNTVMPENGDTAKVINHTTEGVVDEVPAKQ